MSNFQDIFNVPLTSLNNYVNAHHKGDHSAVGTRLAFTIEDGKGLDSSWRHKGRNGYHTPLKIKIM